MARQGSLGGVLGGFQVPDFTDQNHVGVVSQNRPKASGKGQTHLRMDLDLIDPFELVLDRILGRDDLDVLGLDLAERAVKGRRFSRPRRTGHKHDSVRHANELLELLINLFRHSDPPEGELQVRFVQDPHDDTFAVKHRDDRNTNIDLPTRDSQFDSAVLGDPFLGDVHLGHDLQPTDDRRSELVHFRRGRLTLQNAVDSVTDFQARFLGFDVDVASPGLDRFGENLVDQTHDRRLLDLFGILETVRVDPFEHFDVAKLHALQGDQAIDRLGADAQVFLRQALDRLGGGHDWPDLDFEGRRDRVDGGKVEGVRNGQSHPTFAPFEGENGMAVDQFGGEAVEGIAGDFGFVRGEPLELHGAGAGGQQFLGARETPALCESVDGRAAVEAIGKFPELDRIKQRFDPAGV